MRALLPLSVLTALGGFLHPALFFVSWPLLATTLAGRWRQGERRPAAAALLVPAAGALAALVGGGVRVTADGIAGEPLPGAPAGAFLSAAVPAAALYLALARPRSAARWTALALWLVGIGVVALNEDGERIRVSSLTLSPNVLVLAAMCGAVLVALLAWRDTAASGA